MSFKRHQLAPAVIVQALRLYFRFTLSIRDVEELRAERGVVVSREAIRFWVIKVGPLIAANLRRGRERRRAAGIWTRRSSGLVDGECTCGEQSTTKAKFSTSLSRNVPTSMRR